MSLSLYEMYLAHCRRFMGEYHLSFEEIENLPLEILLDIEIVDSKIEAAFAAKRDKDGKKKVFIDQLQF